MNVATEDIRNIKPGRIKPFVCENDKAMYTACALVARFKRIGMPEGVVNYETQKFFAENNDGVSLLLIRPMREGDTFVLNR